MNLSSNRVRRAPILLLVLVSTVLIGCSSTFGPFRITVDLPPATTPDTADPQGPGGGVTLVANTSVNIRSGDSTAYPVVGGLNAGDGAQVLGVGQNDRSWYYISLPGGLRGFVSGGFVTVTGDVSTLPAIDPGPIPTPQPNQGRANLRITALATAQNPVVCGDRTRVTTTVTNTGTAPSDESTLKIAAYAIPERQYVQLVEVVITVPALAPGAQYDAFADLILSANGDGDFALRSFADLNEVIPESDEDDNMLEAAYAVRCSDVSQRPNLAATALFLPTGNVVCGDRTPITFRFANTGALASSEASYVLQMVNSAGGIVVEVSGTVRSMQPGETVDDGADLILSANPNGDYTLRIIVDPANQIAESNEQDNRVDTTVPVACS